MRESELKFLANTNTLLNQCVDKQFYQQAVDVLDQDTIEKVAFADFVSSVY